VPDAPDAVRTRVHYVTRRSAGHGAVREVCEFVLTAQGMLDAAVERYLA
jgi:3-deoxy-D-manno-octulosonate 8-phosphate phosphatase (KDO 8-P phosphatase)